MGGAPDLELAHVDAHCIVAVKPSGLLSVPGRGSDGHDCLSERVRGRYADALVVHRLDMATSGLMLFARGSAAQRTLSRAFAQRDVHKTYVAVVDGRVAHDAGTIDLPLGADWPQRPRQKVDPEHGKPSLSRYRVLERGPRDETTRLELEPVTGRAHQLRVHLLALGHPILGDALYAPPAVQARSARLLLHASALGFNHPASGQRVQMLCAPPF
jgi:tRNA pseudouridine32 synthase/23S rRNA pseudouridine746 synthase